MTPQYLLRWFGGALAAIGLCGCHTPSWDDLTSRELGVKALWTSPPPPMTVIEKSTDGYARAKALNQLDEPSDRTDLDKRIQVLQVAATSDRDPLCRIAALRTLGKYKDPRAAKILEDVYFGNPGMSVENNKFIRQQALTSLQVNSPASAKQLFMQAAGQPGGSLTGSDQRERMEILDERLTAIRALGKYPQPDAAETLVKLLETEKDTAIRKCAHDALVESQKKEIPADGKAWREYMASGKMPAQKNTSMLAGLMKSDPAPAASANNGPGIFETINNWVRPEKQPDATPVKDTRPKPAMPTMLPATLPATPLAPTTTPGVSPNQVQRTPAPPTAREVLPAGAYRNPQGEVVVPVNPQ